jgi:hypothetical protein
VTGRRIGFGRSPAKGTKIRQFLLMALRSQGVTSWEAVQAGLIRERGLSAFLTMLRDMKGYDVKAFRLAPEQRTLARVGAIGVRGKNPPLVYRLVGRMKWDGSYRTFLRLDALDLLP